MFEDSFINQFGLWELEHTYIYGKKVLPALEEEYKELEQSLYDDAPMVSVVHDTQLGRVYFGSGVSVEDFVIEMIERKESFLNLIEKLKKKVGLLDWAMDSLTPRERDVIRVHYFNRTNDLGLSPEFFEEVLTDAQTKLCSMMGEKRREQRVDIEAERKVQMKKNLDEWKRGREVS